ncbi:MAG: hypothetical protein ACOCV2_00575 [Persicimonas sp.]
MSFDIYLYSPDSPFPAANAIESRLLENSNVSSLFEGEGGEFDLVYENQTTGCMPTFRTREGRRWRAPTSPTSRCA